VGCLGNLGCNNSTLFICKLTWRYVFLENEEAKGWHVEKESILHEWNGSDTTQLHLSDGTELRACEYHYK
jgi:hypothetical protein